MPYTGPNDKALPDHVKALPEAARRRWIAIFESVLERTGDEGAAMRAANGVINAMKMSVHPLFPFGKYKTEKYGDIELTEELADELIANFEELRPKIVPFIDRDHEMAEAHGWVGRLFKGTYAHPKTGEPTPGLMADIDWNELGQAAVDNRVYRQLSIWTQPYKDEETGKSYANVLRSVSLTNVPVLKMLPELALSEGGEAREIPLEMLPELQLAEGPDIGALFDELESDIRVLMSKGEEAWKGVKGAPALRTFLKEVGTKISTMRPRMMKAAEQKKEEKEERSDMKDLRKTLQLAEDASDEQVSEAIKQLSEKASVADEAGTKLADAEKKLADLEAAAGDKEKQLADLTKTVGELQLAEVKRDCKEVIEGACAEGKIPPAARETWEKRFLADPEGTRELIETLQPVIPLTKLGETGKNEASGFLALCEKIASEKDIPFTDAMTLAQAQHPEEAAKYLADSRKQAKEVE